MSLNIISLVSVSLLSRIATKLSEELVSLHFSCLLLYFLEGRPIQPLLVLLLPPPLTTTSHASNRRNIDHIQKTTSFPPLLPLSSLPRRHSGGAAAVVFPDAHSHTRGNADDNER